MNQYRTIITDSGAYMPIDTDLCLQNVSLIRARYAASVKEQFGF